MAAQVLGWPKAPNEMTLRELTDCPQFKQLYDQSMQQVRQHVSPESLRDCFARLFNSLRRSSQARDGQNPS